jgi:hypothetical protein
MSKIMFSAFIWRAYIFQPTLMNYFFMHLIRLTVWSMLTDFVHLLLFLPLTFSTSYCFYLLLFLPLTFSTSYSFYLLLFLPLTFSTSYCFYLLLFLPLTVSTSYFFYLLLFPRYKGVKMHSTHTILNIYFKSDFGSFFLL